MAWQFIVGFALALVVTYAIRPKPQSQKPAAFEDLDVPTAEEGKEISVLFGCRDLRSSNVVWYGDYKSKRIRSSGGKK